MSETPHPSLAGALAAAILDAGAVAKAARNDFHRYSYASAESILVEARAALARHGLVATWHARGLDMSRAASIEVVGRKGKQLLQVYAHLVGVVRLSYAHSDQVLDTPLEWPVCLEAGKHADKAVAAAQTSALSYALRDLLLLPRVAEGEDIQSRHDEVHEHQTASRPAAADDWLDAAGVALRAKGWSPDDATEALNKQYRTERTWEQWSTARAPVEWLVGQVQTGRLTLDEVWGETPREAAGGE